MLPPSTNAALAALDDLRSAVRPVARIAVAVSGGFDSTLLLLSLVRAGVPVSAILHVDHGLRGAASAEDADFVRESSERLGIPCFCAEVCGLQGLTAGLEAAARSARYAALARLARAAQVDEIWLGHHRDDQRETVAFRVLRRAGPRGLAGMAPRRPLPDLRTAAEIRLIPPLRNDLQRAAPRTHLAGADPKSIVRPWLHRTRAELKELAEAIGHSAWREDATNADLRFARNRLRHEVLPRAECLDPQIFARIDELQHLALDLHRAQSAIQDPLARLCIERLGEGFVRLKLPPQPLAPELQHALHEALLETLGFGPITRSLSESLAACGSGPLGHRWNLGPALSMRRHADGIDVCVAQSHLPSGDRTQLLPVLGAEGRTQRVRFVPLRGQICVTRCTSAAERRLAVLAAGRSRLRAALDLDALVGRLTLRTPQPGERWKPWRCPGEQKLVKSMNARRVPVDLRSRLPVLADERGALWVPGVGIAERACVREHTAVCIALRFRGPGANRLEEMAGARPRR